MEKRIVITGSAGSGKSSVIEELNRLGYKTVQEPARELIAKFLKEDTSLLPWNDRKGFQKHVESKNVNNWKRNKNGFFDRSLVDEIAYWNYYAKHTPDNLFKKCTKYRYDQVFILPPWQEIFTNDEIRKEDFKTAVEVYNKLIFAYFICNYKTIELPKASVEWRVNFILNNI